MSILKHNVVVAFGSRPDGSCSFSIQLTPAGELHLARYERQKDGRDICIELTTLEGVATVTAFGYENGVLI